VFLLTSQKLDAAVRQEDAEAIRLVAIRLISIPVEPEQPALAVMQLVPLATQHLVA
jgi:hypothetical protein